MQILSVRLSLNCPTFPPPTTYVRQEPNEGLTFGGVVNPVCSRDMDRSAFEFPLYQYCHWDYQSTDPVFTGGNDICGNREIEGNSVIGETGFTIRRSKDGF